MKKITGIVTVFVLSLALTACEGKEQSVTYSLETEVDGLRMTDTMTLNAKGDHVQTITEVVVFDLADFDETTQAALIEAYAAIVEQYNSVEGVECVDESGESSYSITIDIDATGDALSQLMELGLLQVEGDADALSLSATGDALEENRYTLVE